MLIASDVAEVNRFKRLLAIWKRIDHETKPKNQRRYSRRRAACRLVYGAEVETWPAFASKPTPGEAPR